MVLSGPERIEKVLDGAKSIWVLLVVSLVLGPSMFNI